MIPPIGFPTVTTAATGLVSFGGGVADTGVPGRSAWEPIVALGALVSWVDVAERSTYLRSLYPDKDPDLADVRLMEVRLLEDGPTLAVRFNLKEFPKNPPVKWLRDGANMVQVTLRCGGIRQLEMHGWHVDSVGRLQVMVQGELFAVGFRPPACWLEVTFEHLLVSEVTGYFKVEELEF